MIFGVTGTFASGKDTISNYLKEKGFFHFSLSDAIRLECDRRGLPKDRDTLQKIGNELRETQGPQVLAIMATEALKNHFKGGQIGDTVITSIRNPEEVKFLKTLPGFVLLTVDAPIETRYKRVVSRQRESDFVDFETFKKQEEKEMSGGQNQQNLQAVMAASDHEIINDSTLDELYRKVDLLLKNESQDKKNQ